jgi:hypothetical protein
MSEHHQSCASASATSPSSSPSPAPQRREHTDLTRSEPRGNEADFRVTRIADTVGGDGRRVRRLVLTAAAAGAPSSSPSSSPSSFSYEPAQWADVEVLSHPSLPVGGYSFTSAPNLPQDMAQALGVPQLPSVELAIRASRHPTAAYLCSDECRVGEQLRLRPGGTLFKPIQQALLAAAGGAARASALGGGGRTRLLGHILLVAGGVGINPLLSLAYAVSGLPHPPRLSLIYSARTPADLVFAKEIKELQAWRNAARPSAPPMDVTFAVTRGAHSASASASDLAHFGGILDPLLFVQQGRVTPAQLVEAVRRGRVGLSDDEKTMSFVCGPRGLMEETIRVLRAEAHAEAEAREEQRQGRPVPLEVHHESWW